MSNDPLAIYLNDHLAGSVAGLNLMDGLAEQAEGTPLAAKLRALADEVREDQELLREVLERLGAGQRRLHQAAAWVTEKVSEGRLAFTGRNHPALAVFEGLESIALGLQGKLALFRALAEIEPHDTRLTGLPLAARAVRTATQHAMIEQERLAVAHEAFTSADPARA